MKSFRLVGCLVVFLLLVALPAQARKTLRMDMQAYFPPYSFVETRANGESVLRGFSVDLAKEIARKLHSRVKFFHVEGAAKRRHRLLTGRTNAIILDFQNPTPDNDLIFFPIDLRAASYIFVAKDCRTVTCSKDLIGKKVITVKDSGLSNYLARGTDIVYAGTSLEALQKLDQGLADAFLAPSEYAANYWIQKKGMTNIRRVGFDVVTRPLGITLRADQKELQADMKSAYEQLVREGVFARIKAKWFGKTVALKDWQKYFSYIVAGAVLVLLFILAITFWNYQLKKRVRRVTRDLHDSERKYRDLIESSSDMIFLVDRQGCIELCNKSGKAAFADKGMDDLGEPALFGLVPVGQKDRMKTFLGKVFEYGASQEDFTFERNTPPHREVDIIASLITWDGLDNSLACCFARDVTERRQLENELINSERLAGMGKLAASVAHEINNPLGIIQANAEVLLSAKVLPEYQSFLQAILRNAERASKITHGLLTTAKPSSFEPEEVDMAQVVEEALDFLAPRLRDVDLSFRKVTKPQITVGDVNLLQQAVINLVLNAFDSLEDCQKKSIEIRFCETPAQPIIRLVVQDSGKGIPRANLGRIFNPFFTTGKGNGYGMGLFITQRIIERHGGVIYVESEAGVGTEMFVELPHVDEETELTQTAGV